MGKIKYKEQIKLMCCVVSFALFKVSDHRYILDIVATFLHFSLKRSSKVASAAAEAKSRRVDLSGIKLLGGVYRTQKILCAQSFKDIHRSRIKKTCYSVNFDSTNYGNCLVTEDI